MSIPVPALPPRRSRSSGGRVAALVILIVCLAAGYLFWLKPTWSRTDALEAARAGRFEEAKPDLETALQRNHRDAEVLEALARGSFKAGDEEAAAAYLDRWLEAAPDSPDALQLRMEFRIRKREYDRALADGLKLRSLRPGDPKHDRLLVGIAVSAGAFAEAESLCRECLQQEPNDAGLKIRLATIRTSRGDAAGGANLLEDLVAQQPDNMGARQALAMVYLELNRPQDAIPQLKTVIEKDPTRRRTAGYQLSLAFERVGQPDEAKKTLAEVRRRQDVEVFREAIKSQPENLDLRVRLAESLLTDGHTADGLALLGEALNLNPYFPPAHRVLAEHYDRAGDRSAADRHRKLASAP